MSTTLKQAINWNNIDDDMDKVIWEKLLAQFWVATRFPVSNDLKSWNKLHENEKTLVMRVFTGLTLLDTVQGTVGVESMMQDAVTPHEEAVLANIQFMEHIHAQSYSQIFQTLASTEQINEAFRWSEDNDYLQYKSQRMQEIYATADPLQKKIASVMLESFLFYSGFYLPLWLNGHAKLPNSADVLKFIIRDESVHGYYIGYKFQQAFANESAERQEELTDWAYDLVSELYDNEVRYTQELYDEHGLTEDVKAFLRYNANKALMNLGLDPLFPKSDTEFNPIVLNGMSLGTETHDFFSTTGSYRMANSEVTVDEDWDF
jgi:ribonucleoside-diphosphate reductase beta chain